MSAFIFLIGLKAGGDRSGFSLAYLEFPEFLTEQHSTMHWWYHYRYRYSEVELLHSKAGSSLGFRNIATWKSHSFSLPSRGIRSEWDNPLPSVPFRPGEPLRFASLPFPRFGVFACQPAGTLPRFCLPTLNWARNFGVWQHDECMNPGFPFLGLLAEAVPEEAEPFNKKGCGVCFSISESDDGLGIEPGASLGRTLETFFLPFDDDGPPQMQMT